MISHISRDERDSRQTPKIKRWVLYRTFPWIIPTGPIPNTNKHQSPTYLQCTMTGPLERAPICEGSAAWCRCTALTSSSSCLAVLGALWSGHAVYQKCITWCSSLKYCTHTRFRNTGYVLWVILAWKIHTQGPLPHWIEGICLSYSLHRIFLFDL